MLKKLFLSTVLVSSATGFAQTPPVACSAITTGVNGALNGFVPSPADAWHQDISTAQVDPNSNTIVTSGGDLGNSYLHPNFSSIAGGGYGIPYTVVDSTSTPNVTVPVTVYDGDSDITVAPIPANAPIEGPPAECDEDGNDRHLLVLDRNKCVVYEYWRAFHCPAGWSAANNALFDLTLTEKRPYGYTSADAGGLSIFEGLVRYDEIVAGKINHAIRFTASRTKSPGYFTAPATHSAGNNSATDNIMGMRIRLRADFDISGYSSTNQIILKAMKQYGMILADNGSNMFFQGTPDARWNDDDLNRLKGVPSSAFEVVKMGPVYTTATAPTGAAPVINSFTASQTTVPSGTEVTLTPTVTGASYSYIDNVGFLRGPVTVTPTQTTTYLLTSRNEFGTTSASTTVTVTAAGAKPTLTLTPIASHAYGSGTFTVSATSNSTGAITYSVASGPATIAGNAVTLTGTGTVTVQASQAATSTYSAATATTSFTATAGDPQLSFTAVPNKTYGAAPFTVSTTTSSAGSITYSVATGPATVAGNMVTLTGVGTVTLSATQAASGNYAVGTASTSFTVSAATSTLTFAAIPNKTYGDAPFAVSATSASTGAVTYSVGSGPATVAGNTVTLTGVGTVVLNASQVAAGNYAASTATTSFTVGAAAALATPLTFTAVPSQKYGNAPFVVSASSKSTGAITYSVSGPGTIAGKTVTITGAGTIVVQATQAAAGTYAAGSATLNVPVAQIAPSLTIVTIPTQLNGAGAITLKSTSRSTGGITYSVLLNSPARIVGDQLTITGPGTVFLSAFQPASGNYLASTAVSAFVVKQVH